MKIKLLALSSVAILISLVSCKEEPLPGTVPDIAATASGLSISIQGMMNDLEPFDGVKATSGSVVRIYWEEGDKVFVYDGTHNLGQLAVSIKDDDPRYAYLSNKGEINLPAEGTTKLSLIYSKGALNAPAVYDGRISVVMAQQNFSSYPLVLYGELPYQSGQSSIEITDSFVPFSFATAIMKVNCTGLGSGAPASATVSGLNTCCVLTLSSDGVSSVGGDNLSQITRSGSSSFTTADGKAIFSFAVPITAAASIARNLHITTSDGSSFDADFTKTSISDGSSYNTVCELHKQPDEDCVFIGGRYWARQNLAVSASGRQSWKGLSSAAVKVPGTEEDAVFGDFFQWGAYRGYCGSSDDQDLGLLVYDSFTNTYVVGGESDSGSFKTGKGFVETNAPYYIGGVYTRYQNDDENLSPSDDAASIVLGGKWHTPTVEEFVALIKAVYSVWDDSDKGIYLFRPDASHSGGNHTKNMPEGWSKDDALLFMPAAGAFLSTGVNQICGTDGCYWASTNYWTGDGDGVPYMFRFRIYGTDPEYWSLHRSQGAAIRPVSD